jgi:hypothetical protein
VVVFALITAFMVVGVIGGLLTGSLALLAGMSGTCYLTRLPWALLSSPSGSPASRPPPTRASATRGQMILDVLVNGMTLTTIPTRSLARQALKTTKDTQACGSYMLLNVYSRVSFSWSTGCSQFLTSLRFSDAQACASVDHTQNLVQTLATSIGSLVGSNEPPSGSTDTAMASAPSRGFSTTTASHSSRGDGL